MLVALTLLVSSCAVFDPQADEAQRLDQMLAAVVQVSRLPPAAQGRELDLSRQAFAAGRGDFVRLRLGTLLATLPAPLGDDAEAARLLAPLSSGRPNTPIQRFASLMSVQLAARQRLGQALQHSEQQAGELRHKLDELKSIERKALHRDEQLQ